MVSVGISSSGGVSLSFGFETGACIINGHSLKVGQKISINCLVIQCGNMKTAFLKTGKYRFNNASDFEALIVMLIT